MAAAATALSSRRLRSGRRRTSARAASPVAEGGRQRGPDRLGDRARRLGTRSAARRGDVGEHARLGEREHGQPGSPAAGDGEHAGRDRAVLDPAALHRVAEDRQGCRERGAVLRQGGGESVHDLADGEALAGLALDDVGREDVGNPGCRRPGLHHDRRDERARRGAQHALVLRRRGARDDADDGSGVRGIAVGADERGVASRAELPRRAASASTPVTSSGPFGDAAPCAWRARASASRGPIPEGVIGGGRLPGRGRGSPAGSPIATRFATIDEPPTVTNGSGMPVTGAMPIVMPTLTNTWNRKAKTIPPATTAPYRSPATVITRRPRQTTSR